ALEIMGVNSSNYLILPKVVALVLCLPLLVVFSVFFGLIGGMGVAFFTDMITVADFVYGMQYAFVPYYLTYSLIKSLFFGFIIASISAFYGYYAYGGALDVGRASTNAVVNSSIFILLMNIVLTQLLLT
ncbi:MAG: ABC transporter permease, partial [Paludibacteraceae bacterium]|nr:ABC transporter permease [Paludibacteraceae bacterium]